MFQQAVDKITENAPAMTYTGTGASIMLWNLHVSEVCVIISTTVSVLGFALQVYLAWRRTRRK
jgi:hypothetical protein